MSQPQDKTVFDPAPPASRFLVWLALLIASAVAIFYNFTLLDGLMAKLVGGQARIFGDMSVASVGAAVLVILEVCNGLFFLESRSVTHMFPVIHALPAASRWALGYVFGFLIVCFAGIQAGLAWLNITGHGYAIGIPRYGPMIYMPVEAQMAAAFVLPFLLILAGLSMDRVVRALRRQAT
jgi:hypothetical protein